MGVLCGEWASLSSLWCWRPRHSLQLPGAVTGAAAGPARPGSLDTVALVGPSQKLHTAVAMSHLSDKHASVRERRDIIANARHHYLVAEMKRREELARPAASRGVGPPPPDPRLGIQAQKTKRRPEHYFHLRVQEAAAKAESTSQRGKEVDLKAAAKATKARVHAYRKTHAPPPLPSTAHGGAGSGMAGDAAVGGATPRTPRGSAASALERHLAGAATEEVVAAVKATKARIAGRRIATQESIAAQMDMLVRNQETSVDKTRVRLMLESMIDRRDGAGVSRNPLPAFARGKKSSLSEREHRRFITLLES